MSNENEATKVVNNSGEGPQAVVPYEVKNHFNWGAFFFSWIWGICNKSYITLVAFTGLLVCWIPIVGTLVPLGFSIWFGIKGNEWAWQNKKFPSVVAFHEHQKKWAMWGVILFAVSIVLLILIGITGAVAALSGMSQY